MERVLTAARGGDAEDVLSRFRRLVTLTLGATFILILIGGIVRVSDSGLGCGAAGSGTHGWPLCEGGVLPAASAESAIEFSHRVAAGVAAVLIALLVWRAFRQLRDYRWIVRGTVAAGVLVLIQAALGGLTVEQGLEEELVAAHLGLAMVLLGLLVMLRRASDGGAEAPTPESVRGLRATTLLAGTLLLATIVAGGYVAGTEQEGTPGEPALGQAHVACGTGYSADAFPACNGRFPGFGQSRLADIQLVHRSLMYLAAIAVLAMAAVALRRRAPSRAFALAALLLVAQIALGVANVWAGKHAGLILGHLALGTVLWGTVVYAGATLLPASAPVGEQVGSRDVAGAVTA
jgi:heme A synthase